MELLHMKNTIFEMNSTAAKINRWFDITEQERLVIFEEIVIETNQNETEKKAEKPINSISNLSDNISSGSLTYI